MYLNQQEGQVLVCEVCEQEEHLLLDENGLSDVLLFFCLKQIGH